MRQLTPDSRKPLIFPGFLKSELEPHDLAPAQAVEGGEQHAQLQLRSLHQLEELLQLLGVVGVGLAGVLLRALNLVRRVAGDQVRLVGVLQSLSDVGVVVQHGAGLDSQLLDLVAAEGLDVAGRHLLEQQLWIVPVEIGVDPGADGLFVGGVGGDLQADFIMFSQSNTKAVKKRGFFSTPLLCSWASF